MQYQLVTDIACASCGKENGRLIMLHTDRYISGKSYMIVNRPSAKYVYVSVNIFATDVTTPR